MITLYVPEPYLQALDDIVKQGRWESLHPGVTADQLRQQFHVRYVPKHGEAIVVPERLFKPDWKPTLESQGHKVLHCADMPGGDVYLVLEGKKAIQMEKHVPKEATEG